jgi:hypothetical protein
MEAEQQQEFDKAFLATMGDEELPVVEDAVVVEEQPEAPVEEEVIERVEVIDGFTKEELKEHLSLIPKLQKALDTTNGTYGAKLAELNKAIESLKAKPEEGEAESNGGTQSITLDALKEEYPDIAELLAKDLHGRSGGNSEDVIKVVEAKFAEERAAREADSIEASRKRLARAHPDFRDIALYQVEDGIVKFPDPGFGNWLANQPKDKFDTVIGSKDADDLSDILTEYKQSTKSPAVANKKSSLEAAILPKGNGLTGRTMTEKEIEEAAFRAAMAD